MSTPLNYVQQICSETPAKISTVSSLTHDPASSLSDSCKSNFFVQVLALKTISGKQVVTNNLQQLISKSKNTERDPAALCVILPLMQLTDVVFSV